MKTWKLAAASAAAGAGLCAAGLWLGANKLFNEAIRRKQTSPDGGEDAADVRLRAALRAGGRAYLDSVPHEFWRMQSFDGLSLVAEYIPAAVPTPRTLLCIHGYTSTGRREFSPVARALRGVQPYFAGRPRPRPKRGRICGLWRHRPAGLPCLGL